MIDEPPIVLVSWEDTGAHLDKGWKSVQEYVDAAADQVGLVETAGFLIHEDDQNVLVALSWDAVNKNPYSVQVIHRSAVRAIVYPQLD